MNRTKLLLITDNNLRIALQTISKQKELIEALEDVLLVYKGDLTDAKAKIARLERARASVREQEGSHDSSRTAG